MFLKFLNSHVIYAEKACSKYHLLCLKGFMSWNNLAKWMDSLHMAGGQSVFVPNAS
jgi:hypothetical protein